jgi:hypothetical protein
VAAVRATPRLAAWVASLGADAPTQDAAIAEVVRTARTEKGAIWLATRVAPAAEDPAKQDGQEATAIACLRKLAAAGHPAAIPALAAWEAAEAAAMAAATEQAAAEIAADLAAEA